MIGDRVKALRKEKKMSLTELAEQAGVAKSYISSLERNLQKNPSIQFLEKIAPVLGVTVNSLLDPDSDEKNVDSEWVNLAKTAMESGISKEQFKEFIEFNKWRINQK
ncbi:MULTISPECIES: helix-turn-helix domain-containing protein [Jeotgalibacillus]|uniref:Helix-turn-helix domain-containing protein n=1 Tax=Jeotgalibacillus haloalkalitolerans TaxID=3104292 RepID=A0ABU5KQH3_9BACL|nr:helix-turn-helix domain-containing protein [Jeotgalibacillus sp. HH7-29]MDZ5713497.1 helix-turn-helix domain-containing protein [Jeotgalibacillus sp. HH7-29]